MPISAKAVHIVGTDLANGTTGDGPIKRMAMAANNEPKSIEPFVASGHRSISIPQKGALSRYVPLTRLSAEIRISKCGKIHLIISPISIGPPFSLNGKENSKNLWMAHTSAK